MFVVFLFLFYFFATEWVDIALTEKRISPSGGQGVSHGYAHNNHAKRIENRLDRVKNAKRIV